MCQHVYPACSAFPQAVQTFQHCGLLHRATAAFASPYDKVDTNKTFFSEPQFHFITSRFVSDNHSVDLIFLMQQETLTGGKWMTEFQIEK